MLISRMPATAATAHAVAQPRTIQVHQTFFPDARGVIHDGPHLTVLSGPWAAEPRSVNVGGKTYPVAHVASRGRGTPVSQYRVSLPTLPGGNNHGTVKLANGVSVPVIFHVESAY